MKHRAPAYKKEGEEFLQFSMDDVEDPIHNLPGNVDQMEDADRVTHLVAPKVVDRLVSKQAMQKFEMERFNLNKPNDLDVKNSIMSKLKQVCSFGHLQ
jgi:hypothetical protein